MRRQWNSFDPGLHQVFCAALSGFVANKDFHGPVSQGSARAAIDFADEVVLLFLADQPKQPNGSE